jgi:hypothetical protein
LKLTLTIPTLTQVAQSRGVFGWKKARVAIGWPSASNATENEPGILSRLMSLTITDTLLERRILKARAASKLPTLFSKATAIGCTMSWS